MSGARIKLIALGLLLSAAASSLFVWSPERLLVGGLSDAGGAWPWAQAGFIVVFALGTFVFFPKPVLNVAAGALFGISEGLVLAVAGTTLGAVTAFVLGRVLGQEALRSMLRGKFLREVDRELTARGFRSVFLLRLLPGVPFPMVNYSAAVSGMRLRVFTVATALGVVPMTAAYVLAGASASSPTSPAFVGAVTSIIVLTALMLLLARRRRRAAA